MMRRMVVTSALPYANGPIHLGHLVEYIQTDIWVRFQKLRGQDCVYFCADDTHGTPIMIRARKEGISPSALVERMHGEHLQDFKGFFIDFDIYSSTNTEENRLLAEEVYIANRDAGHIGIKDVRQAYCRQDKMFLPDRFIRGICPACGAPQQYGDSCEHCSATYAPTDLKEPQCAICGEPPEERESEHYFFKLGDFAPFLQEWTRSGTLQEQMANKLTEWFDQGLKDWDISRDGPYFGFEIPDAPGKFFYVWLDAPIGYMAATLQYCKLNNLDFAAYWRREDYAEIYHFIGKDILYFHTLFWPAMLKGAGFRTPTSVFAHGFLTVNGQKMSKSRGTFINARQYLECLDPEYLRYYYAGKLTQRVDDLDLNLDDFGTRVNSDLVGKVVNLASRTAGFINKRFAGMLASPYPEDEGLFAKFCTEGEKIAQLYEDREYARAMRTIMALADDANRFVEAKAPWNLARDGQDAALQAACSVALNLFRLLMIYLQPVLPVMAQKSRDFLNSPTLLWHGELQPLHGHTINKFAPLMVRVDPQKVADMLAATGEKIVDSSPPPPAGHLQKVADMPATGEKVVDSPPPPPVAEEVGIEDFSKVDLRVARIICATAVEGADKLLELRLDLGALGQRTVFAGIQSAYSAESLNGRLTVVVANLKPRKMQFGLSEGMVLAAGPGGKNLFLLSPDSGAEPGMKVK